MMSGTDPVFVSLSFCIQSFGRQTRRLQVLGVLRIVMQSLRCGALLGVLLSYSAAIWRRPGTNRRSGDLPAMSIRDDFLPFKEPAFLITLAILCAGILSGIAVMKYCAS